MQIFAIDPIDELSNIQAVRDDLGLTFDLLRGKGTTIVSDYDIGAYPTTLVVDRTGKVQFRLLGYSGGSDLAKIRQELNQLFQ